MGCLSIAYPLLIPCLSLAEWFSVGLRLHRLTIESHVALQGSKPKVLPKFSRDSLESLSGVCRGSVGGRSADRGLNLLFYWLQEEQKTGLQRA